jgi:hypothetical protein
MELQQIKKVVGGAVTAATVGTQAYKIYQKGMKLMGPIECPWCYKDIPRDLFEAHLLQHKGDHDVCQVKRAVAGGMRAGKEAAKAYKKQEKEAPQQAKRAREQGRRSGTRHRE